MRVLPHRRVPGFTFVEVMISAALVLMTVGLFVAYMWQGRQREARVDFKTRCLRSAQIVRSYLEEDLDHLLPGRDLAGFSARGSSLTFDRLDSARTDGPGGLPLTEELAPRRKSVTWAFDPKTFRLLRDGQVVGAGLFKDVEFAFSLSESQGYRVQIDLTFVPEEELGQKDPPTRTLKQRYRFHSPAGTTWLVHWYWATDP